MAIGVRKAEKTDAEPAIKVLHRSISELCCADHGDDEREIAAWLSNKTESAWLAWLHRSDAAVLVAEKDNHIVGVGMIDRSGEVLLNYVHPDARFSGISKAILKALEDVAREWQLQKCRLESTITAKPFYESCGYNPESTTGLELSKCL